MLSSRSSGCVMSWKVEASSSSSVCVLLVHGTARGVCGPLRLAPQQSLVLLQALQGFFDGPSQATVGVDLDGSLQVPPGSLALSEGHERRSAIVVGDAEPRVQLYRRVGGLERRARVTGGVQARAQGRVVAGEGAAGDEALVDGGGSLVFLAP